VLLELHVLLEPECAWLGGFDAGAAGGRNSLSGTAIDVTGMWSLPRHCQANFDHIATHYDNAHCHDHSNMQFYD
jgi:hypothetical protein